MKNQSHMAMGWSLIVAGITASTHAQAMRLIFNLKRMILPPKYLRQRFPGLIGSSPDSLSSTFESRGLAAMALALVALGLPYEAMAQVDTFNNGNDADWLHDNPIAPYGGTTTYSFPAGPSGRGYRLQCTSSSLLEGLCGQCGTARTFSYKATVYKNFRVSVDIVNWNNNLDQALVLLARGTGLNSTADPCPLGPGECPPGFATASGYVCNYDPNQFGVGGGGQFQINTVTGENPVTIAAANISLDPGKSYRMVFIGVGTRLTASLYHAENLFAPIVTIQADDATYAEGVSGLISYSRDGTVTDVTYDNFVSLAVPGMPSK
jgi:hypothetical protein